MPDLPAIAHVTLTVSDLDRSVQWYERLFDVAFHRDESPGPFRRAVWIVEGRTLVGLHDFPDPLTPFPSMSVESGWTIWPSPVEAGRISRRGYAGSRNSISTTAESQKPTTALGSHAVTPTTSLWSSISPPPKWGAAPSGCIVRL